MGRTSDDILCTVGNAKTSVEIKRQDLQVAQKHTDKSCLSYYTDLYVW